MGMILYHRISIRILFFLFLPPIHGKDIGMNAFYVYFSNFVSPLFPSYHHFSATTTKVSTVILQQMLLFCIPRTRALETAIQTLKQNFFQLPMQNARFFKVICAHFILQTFLYKKFHTKKE